MTSSSDLDNDLHQFQISLYYLKSSHCLDLRFSCCLSPIILFLSSPCGEKWRFVHYHPLFYLLPVVKSKCLSITILFFIFYLWLRIKVCSSSSLFYLLPLEKNEGPSITLAFFIFSLWLRVKVCPLPSSFFYPLLVGKDNFLSHSCHQYLVLSSTIFIDHQLFNNSFQQFQLIFKSHFLQTFVTWINR